MRSSLSPLSVVAAVSAAGLLLLLAAAVCSAQSAPFYLTSIGSVNGTLVEGVLVPGASQPVFVRNEAFSVTPASNNAAPSSAAVSRLQSINHFIIVVLNQESFDAVMGAYPKGNTLNNSAAPPSPAVALQVQRPQFTGTAATPGLTSGAPYSSLPVDTDGSAQINVSLPNAPYLYNSFFPPTMKVQQDPPHGYQQAIYKIDGGRMDGFQWTSDTSGELAMGHWLLTGSNLYALAANFTLFDRFFGSAFGGPLLGHFYIIGGRSTQWDNGNSQPPLVLQDNATLSYHNYSTADGLMTDVTQEGIMSWPDNFLLNNIHSPAFCGPPFWPIINDASTHGVPAHLGDQLTAANVSWGYYAQDWNSEVIEALTGDNCHAWNNDSKMSSNMLPFTHYARFNPPRTAPASLQHLQDLDNATTANFFSKLAAGQLESVAWVQPDKRFDWGGGDVAPAPADAWLGSTMQAIYASPHWQAQDTMVIVTWENANGFYDHVPPYAGDRFGPGLRVATIVASPYHAGGLVNSNPYEHLSIIKMIQRRFGLLNQTDASGANVLLGQARDQSSRDFTNTFTDLAAPTTASSTGSYSSAAGHTAAPTMLMTALALLLLLLTTQA